LKHRVFLGTIICYKHSLMHIRWYKASYGRRAVFLCHQSNQRDWYAWWSCGRTRRA
jgi:hypothetical protein